MSQLIRGLLIAGAMIGASIAGAVLTPTQRLAHDGMTFDLESVVPRAFGEWKIDPFVVPVMLSPDVQAKLDEVYNQTIARTYVNDRGQRIMLSIAYGGDQGGDGTQAHRPEFCYSAQGFQLFASSIGDLATSFGALPVRRLVATMGSRVEPITYWVTVGEMATRPGWERKVAQWRYGLRGVIPDGMLVRVSSIDRNFEGAYELQERFVASMLSAIKPEHRVRLAGRLDARS